MRVGISFLELFTMYFIVYIVDSHDIWQLRFVAEFQGKRLNFFEQVPVRTMMRPGSGLIVVEENEEIEVCCGGGQFWFVPKRLRDVLSIDFQWNYW